MQDPCCVLVVATPDGDRRQELRFKVDRPCRIFPADAGPRKIDGVVQDISRSGIRVFLPETDTSGLWLRVGGAARIVLDLPQSDKYAPRCLECAGRVVRVGDKLEDGSSVAFEIQRVRVRGNGRRQSDESAELLQANSSVRTQ
jgi:PilZ domain